MGSLMGYCSTYARVPFCVNADKNVQSELVVFYNAYTRSLSLSDTYESITQTDAIAPLFKTSPPDITTLFTLPMLTQGTSTSEKHLFGA